MLKGLAVAFVMVFYISGIALAGDVKYLYVKDESTIYIDKEHSKIAGNIYPGARVIEVLKKNGWVKINITGWRQFGLKCVIYAFEGKRIYVAELNKDGVARVKVLKTEEDPETQLKWEKVQLPGVWIKENMLVDNVNKVWEKASTLFHQRCSMCHALPHTTTFTANQWPATLRVMTKRAALTQKEASLVSLYLQYHAKDMKK